jgi:hypothetical protein
MRHSLILIFLSFVPFFLNASSSNSLFKKNRTLQFLSAFTKTNVSISAYHECLVADFPFSGNANDVSGNNNHGLVNGAILTTDRFGNQNSAYQFDGIDDFIEVLPISDVTSVSDFTLIVWIKPDEWDEQPGVNANNLDRQYIFDGHSYSSTTTNNFYREGVYTAINLDYQYNEKIMCGFWENNNSYPVYSNINLTDNWHFIAYSKNGNTVKQYFDGILINSYSAIDTEMDMQHNWYIGTFSGNNPYYDDFNYNFHGKIDDIKIFNCSLSDSEIEELYNPNIVCLIAKYPFNGNAADSSGNNNDATVYGATLTTDRYGVNDAAYYFDGIDDYLDLNAPLLPTNGSEWSLSLWFKQNNPADDELKNIFSQYELDEGRFHTFIYNNELRVFSSNMQHGFTIFQADTNWNHLSFISYDNLLDIYYNCRLVADSIQIAPILNTNSLIGKDGSYISNRYFKGKIDDVSIFHCRLTYEEILQLCSFDKLQIPNLMVNFNVFPNPCYKSLNVEYTPFTNEAEISIYNITGNLIYRTKTNSSPFTINTSSFPQGIYIIRFQTADYKTESKFIKLK